MPKTQWLLAALLASSAGAQPSPINASAAQKLGDPNKIVCETQEQIGSRLGGHKVCVTVKEWDDLRMQNQQIAESIQSGVKARPSEDPALMQSPFPR